MSFIPSGLESHQMALIWLMNGSMMLYCGAPSSRSDAGLGGWNDWPMLNGRLPYASRCEQSPPRLATRSAGSIAGTSRVVVDLFYLGIKAGSHRSGRDVVQRVRKEAARRSAACAR